MPSDISRERLHEMLKRYDLSNIEIILADIILSSP